MQQGWPAGAQQILIPSAWPQMPGVTIHSVDSPLGAGVSEGQQASGWRSVGGFTESLLKMILVCPHACGWILHRGRYGNQFEGLSQQDSGVSRQGASQSHNTGATHPRTQQGKRSKGRHGDKRARYPGDVV